LSVIRIFLVLAMVLAPRASDSSDARRISQLW